MSKIIYSINKESHKEKKFEECIKKWQSRTLNNSTDYHLALEGFKVLFTYNSNAIENIKISCTTTKDFYTHNNVSFEGDPRDIITVSNQNNLFDVMLKDICLGKDITLDLIREYHGILLAGCYDMTRWTKGERPGEFKNHQYCVGSSDVGSEPEDVKLDLCRINAEILNANKTTIENSLKAVAYFHLEFEQIHPFADGNGRLGRNLINFLLLKAKLPPVIIFEECRDTYFMAFEVYNRSGKINGFVQFLKEQMVETYERCLQI